jgi:hypothetical protein
MIAPVWPSDRSGALRIPQPAPSGCGSVFTPVAESQAQTVRHQVLIGIVERLARAPDGGSFVLRGGLLTRLWIAPRRRTTRDLDYVGDFAFDVDDTRRRFAPALQIALPDEVCIDAGSLTAHGIWLDSAFPGVRLALQVGHGRADQPLTIDIGFNDPLVPPATTIALPNAQVRAVRPETQLAWKLHALAEMGEAWRPKDLADLWLITSRVALVASDLPPAIEAAFTSRGYRVEDAVRLLDQPYWTTKTARVRWTADKTGAPELPVVLTAVRGHLGPVLEAMR